MTVLVAMGWSRASANVPGPAPMAAVQRRLIAGIAHGMASAPSPLRPLRLTLESWKRPEGVPRPADNDFLCRMRIELAALPAAPGQETSFARWYQWQHPLWRWSAAPFPLQGCLALAAAEAVP